MVKFPFLAPYMIKCGGVHACQENADRVLGRFDYAHPLYTVEGVRAQAERDAINGVDHTYFAGAYWGYGFHEDGVNSALAVGAKFGKTL